MKKLKCYVEYVIIRLVNNYKNGECEPMKLNKKLFIAFIILGIIGILTQFTPLREIRISTGRTFHKTESLPIVLIALGFGSAGAMIELWFRNKK